MSGDFARFWRRARKLDAVIREPAYRRALLRGTAAAVEHEAVPFARDFRAVIDVGAHRGQFALVATRRFPRAALFCVEPLPGPRRVLRRVLRGHHRLEVIGAAATACSGDAEMLVARADDSSSLMSATTAQLRAFPATEQIARVTVCTGRLDEWIRPEQIRRPALMKVDVQGAELQVLEGAAGLLQSVHSVLVECSFLELYRGQALADEVVRFLHGRGYSIVAVCSPQQDRSGRLIQADLLFERA